MLSTTLEICGFAAIVTATWELAGRGIALLVLGFVLLFIGVAASEVTVRVRLPRRKRKPKPPRGGEPLTNRALDAQED